MVKRYLYLLMLIIIGSLLIGCENGKTPTSSEKDSDPTVTEVATEAVGTMLAKSDEIEDFPEGIPLPESFIVNLDMNMAGMRNIVIETGEADLQAMVDRFNKEALEVGYSDELLKGMGASEPLEEMEKDETGLFKVTGTIVAADGSHVMITIGEYEPDGARVKGNTASITYMIY